MKSQFARKKNKKFSVSTISNVHTVSQRTSSSFRAKNVSGLKMYNTAFGCHIEFCLNRVTQVNARLTQPNRDSNWTGEHLSFFIHSISRKVLPTQRPNSNKFTRWLPSYAIFGSDVCNFPIFYVYSKSPLKSVLNFNSDQSASSYPFLSSRSLFVELLN